MIIYQMTKEMTDEQKLSFLTDVFILTEDMRHEISYGEEDEKEMQGNEQEPADGSSITDGERTGEGSDRSDEGDEQ